MIRGEEITDSAEKKPVHLNMLGGEGLVAPQGGATPAEALRRNVAAIKAARGVVSINHPNFGWALSAADLLEGRGAELLEIYNAHYQVNNEGGGGQPGTEALWDSMLSAGMTIFGVASDDVHELKRPWVKTSARPGLGWIVVRAPRLTADAILAAIARGDFYASTGVELTDIQATPQRLTVTIKELSYARYRVQFIGKGGRVLAEASAEPLPVRHRRRRGLRPRAGSRFQRPDGLDAAGGRRGQVVRQALLYGLPGATHVCRARAV